MPAPVLVGGVIGGGGGIVGGPVLVGGSVVAPPEPRRLIAVHEPSSEFFKDEGGKRNTLVFVVGASWPIEASVPLKHPRLCFESYLPCVSSGGGRGTNNDARSRA